MHVFAKKQWQQVVVTFVLVSFVWRPTQRKRDTRCQGHVGVMNIIITEQHELFTRGDTKTAPINNRLPNVLVDNTGEPASGR